MKKSLVLALVAVLVLSFASMAFAFTDTTSHWANAYINKLVDAKVLSGVTATTFAPDAKVTRAEFAKMIVGAKGLALENPATATFSDVATTAWYFPYVEAAAKAKLIDGVGAGKFDPAALVTREQVAKMVVLAAGLKADDTKAINFDDKAQISDWAKGFVAVAADAKLVTGYNNKFSPKANATRAEAAKLVYEEMLYEGKITPVTAEVPAGFMKVTDTPADNTAIELDGTEYTIDNDNFKIAGEYVNDARLFIDGTLVKVTMNDDDEILSIEADPKVVTGEVDGKGTIAGDKALTVDGKDVTWIDDADYDPALTNADADIFGYNEIAAGDKVVVLLNNEGLGYAALAADSTTAKGEITAYGTTKNDEYYFVVDGKKYLSDEDEVGTSSVKFFVYNADGTEATSFAAFETLMGDDTVGEIETDASGFVDKVTAYSKEISGPISFASWSNVVIFDSKRYENIFTVGSIKIGQKGGAGGSAIDQKDFRILNGSAAVTINGTAVDFEDLDTEIDDATDYSATATVNGAGEVVKIAITDATVYGQISAFTENDNNEVTKVTINGTSYDLSSDYDNTSDTLKKGYFVYGTIETDGELKIDKTIYPEVPALEAGSTVKFQQYVVVATKFVSGYDPVLAANPASDKETSLVSSGTNNIRIQNVDSGTYYEVQVTTFVKGSDDVKANTLKAGDTIILVDKAADALVDEDDLADNLVIDYAVVAPITSTK